jgi:hypothetical protein
VAQTIYKKTWRTVDPTTYSTIEILTYAWEISTRAHLGRESGKIEDSAAAYPIKSSSSSAA